MKKIIITFLLTGLLFSMAACGNNNNVDDNSNALDNTTGNTEGNTNTDNTNDNNAGNTENNKDNNEGSNTGNTNNMINSEETMGQILLQDFVLKAEADETLGPQELADEILKNEVIQFTGTTMEVQPGFLTGFDKEIQGFENGVMFSPVIGSIPFVGYVFQLEKEEDANAFMSTISENANPRWNVCTQADEIVMDHVGNKVFFLMCPINMED